MGDERADALEKRLAKEDAHTDSLVSRLDAFLAKMEVISERLIARLDEQDKQEERNDHH